MSGPPLKSRWQVRRGRGHLSRALPGAGAGMADKFTEDQRYRMMAGVRKFGNLSTEVRMMTLFREHGIKGWRRHLALPGRPDFTFRRERVVIFIDGCFWHRCPQCGSI